MKTIDNVQVTGGANGNRLQVEIPSGMTGVKLMKWKVKNAKAIEEATALTPEVEPDIPVIGYKYNKTSKRVDVLVDGEVRGDVSSDDVPYLTSRSRDEIWSGRVIQFVKELGIKDYKLGWYTNGNGCAVKDTPKV